MSDGALDDRQLEHYREHGYVVVRGLFEPSDLGRWVERLGDIVAGRVAPAKRMLVMRDVMVVKGAVEPEEPMETIAKIQDFESDPVLDSYCRDDRILDRVEQLIGPDIQSIHSMLINKPPHVDGRHPLHQDLVYFPFRPADAIVASWTALEPMSRESGCLVVVPGTHRGELRDHVDMDWEHANAGYWGAKDVPDADRRVHIECQAGDTLFFHPLVLHGSGRNRTSGFRRAISCHYASTRCEKIWNEKDRGEDSRWYRCLRGSPAEPVEVPFGLRRPGAPKYRFPKSTRRA